MSICNSMLYAQRLHSTAIAIFLCKSSNIQLNGCGGCIPSPDYNNLIQGCDWPRATDGRITMSATTVHIHGTQLRGFYTPQGFYTSRDSTNQWSSTHPWVLQTIGWGFSHPLRLYTLLGFYTPPRFNTSWDSRDTRGSIHPRDSKHRWFYSPKVLHPIGNLHLPEVLQPLGFIHIEVLHILEILQTRKGKFVLHFLGGILVSEQHDQVATALKG